MQLQLRSGRKNLHLSDGFDVLLRNCCHRPRSMRNRVCVMVRCPSVSVPFARCISVRRVCCCGAAAARRYRSITAWPAPQDTTVCSQLSRLSADTCFFFFFPHRSHVSFTLFFFVRCPRSLWHYATLISSFNNNNNAGAPRSQLTTVIFWPQTVKV